MLRVLYFLVFSSAAMAFEANEVLSLDEHIDAEFSLNKPERNQKGLKSKKVRMENVSDGKVDLVFTMVGDNEVRLTGCALKTDLLDKDTYAEHIVSVECDDAPMVVMPYGKYVTWFHTRSVLADFRFTYYRFSGLDDQFEPIACENSKYCGYEQSAQLTFWWNATLVNDVIEDSGSVIATYK